VQTLARASVGGVFPRKSIAGVRSLLQPANVASLSTLAGPALLSLVWLAGYPLGPKVPIAILTVVGFILLAYGLIRPGIGLSGAALLCTIDSISRAHLMSGGLLRWNTFNYALIVLAILKLPLLAKWTCAPLRIAAALSAILALQLIQSEDFDAGAQHLLGLISFFGLLAVARSVKNDRAAFLNAACLSAIISVTGAGVLLSLGAGSSAMNQNAYAYFPLAGSFAACAALPLVASSSSWRRVLLPLILLNCGWAAATGSRAGMLLALLCFIWMLTAFPGIRTKVTASVAAGLCTLFLLVIASDKFAYTWERLQRTMDGSRTLANRTSGRSDLFLRGWALFLEQPLGAGTGSFASAQLDDATPLQNSSIAEKRLQAHSAWIKTLAENGLQGLLLLLALVASFWRTTRGLGDPQIRISGIFTSLILAAAFLATEFQSKPLWMLAAMSASLAYAEGRAARKPVKRPATVWPGQVHCGRGARAA
jgi:hypothetical protein